MTKDSCTDEHWIRHCLSLARLAEGRTSPNPIVGAVVLDRRGTLVGEGYHERAGEAHAEKIALEAAGSKAVGGTLYTNLEPCKHLRNRRTTPCAPLVLQSGVARLVMGQSDPIRGHAGGAAWLAKQGISVTRGVLRAECKEANRAFTMWAKAGRPLYTLKVATTLDGKIATQSGESKWITGSAARADGRGLRNRLDAILVGIGTVLADNPRLTARGAGLRDPLRVIVDSRLRTPLAAKVLPANSRSKAQVVIATTAGAAKSRERRLVNAGATVLRLPAVAGRPCLVALSSALAQKGVLSVLVEGGARIHEAFLQAGLCDELRLYLAPKVFGGGKSWLGGPGVARIADAYCLKWQGPPTSLGEDILLRAVGK